MNWQIMLFTSQGRIRRAEYWGWSLGADFGLAFCALVFGYIAYSIIARFVWPGLYYVLYFPLAAFLVLTWTWKSVCLTAKRWHDIGKSGWWALLMLVPVIGWLWTLAECGWRDGQVEENEYGPSPKGMGYVPDVF
jgi:uncharacterized membrane protein YhaH (DUF805 family)